MKQTLRRWAVAAAGLTTAVLASSCAYDPYYSGSSASIGYSDIGYSGGDYYGGSGVSTSIFISTGSPQWGYDPYCHSYYDYYRRAYYDPFLYGYYPVGYRPPIIYGVPHPHGWRPGSRYCPPPSRVRNTMLSDYRNRESLYRRSNHSWANQARQRGSGTRFQPDSNYGRPRPNMGNRDPRGGNQPFVGNRPGQRDFSRNNFNRGDRGNTRENSPFPRPSQPSFGGFQRPSMPDRSHFQQRPETQGRPQFQNRPEIQGRPQFQQRPQMPDRSQFQPRQQMPDRSQFRDRSRPEGRPSPSGFNNPVRLAPERSAPSIQRENRPTPGFNRPSAPSGGERRGGGGDRGGFSRDRFR